MQIKFFLVLLFSIFIPQIIKVFLEFKKKGNIFMILTETGGMPSSHASVTSAITTAIALNNGFDSLFFLSLTFTLLTLRDAIGVRYSVGEQAKAINKLNNIMNKKYKYDLKEIKIIKGHTFSQVLIGAIIGIIIALVVFRF